MARNIVRFNPMAELDALQKQFFGDDFFTSFRGVALPTTDVYTEGDNQLVVEAHLPNFDEQDVSINVDEGALVVQAEKRQKTEDTNKKYMVRESSTSFYRRITLPDRADDENIHADFANGVLKVVVPFKELASPRKIAINAGSANASAGSVAGGASDQEMLQQQRSEEEAQQRSEQEETTSTS